MEVSRNLFDASVTLILTSCFAFVQVEGRIAMLTLVLVLGPSTWMMLLVLQVLAAFWSALAGQSYHITVITFMMLVWGVQVMLVFDFRICHLVELLVNLSTPEN